ncbi:MAG: adenylate kinase [Chloroflexota bacterium]
MVLFGPPGAGKGTQAKLLAEQLEVCHISSGDLFRRHLQEGTPLGLRASEYMNRGLLVPDKVTIDIVLDRVLSLAAEAGFILDGFPRNPNQAKTLEKALKRDSRGLDKVVHIDVSELELVRRLGGRYTCRRCHAPNSVSLGGQTADGNCLHCGGELYQRPDDTPEAVVRRFQVYRTETVPVLGFYRTRGLLADIPGEGSVESVNRRVLSALGRD